MSQEIFYNSSLPRSGSTLLQNVFNQNPNIYAKIYKVDYKKGIIIQEKLNTSVIKKELDYLTKKLKEIGYDDNSFK
jgi:hypothetical protein